MQGVSNETVIQFDVHWKKNWNHFGLKTWVTGGTKIRPGNPSDEKYILVLLTRYWESS